MPMFSDAFCGYEIKARSSLNNQYNEIIKRKEIVPVTQDEIVVDLNRIAFVLDKIMNKWASPVNNTEFGSMLRNAEG